MKTKLSTLSRRVSSLQRKNTRLTKVVNEYVKADQSRHFGQSNYLYNREDQYQPSSGEDYLSLYTKYTHVFACVDAIARNLAKLPLKIYKLKSISSSKDRRSEEVTDGPIWSLFNTPNKFTSGYGLRYGIVAFIKLLGTSYLEKVGRDLANPTELWLLRPDWMKIKADAIELIAGYDYTVDGSVTHYTPEEILHIKSWHPMSEFYGLSVLSPAQNSIITDLYAMKYSQQFFKQGGHLNWYVTAKEEISDSSYKRMEQQLKTKITGIENAHIPPLLDTGMEIKELGGTPDRNVLLPQKTLSRDEVCENFGVPALMLGLPNETHYNNADAQYLFFWEQTEMPIGRELEDTINREILWPLDMECEHDYSRVKVLRPQVSVLATVAKTLIEAKVMTPNETRSRILKEAYPDLEDIEGGDKFPAPAPSPFGMHLGFPPGGNPQEQQGIPAAKGLTIDLVLKLLELVKGGQGSGNYGHAGRPGEIGGSSGVSQAENGQITLKTPKNMDEAIAMMSAMNQLLSQAEKDVAAGLPMASLRLHHVIAQHARAQHLVQTVMDDLKSGRIKKIDLEKKSRVVAHRTKLYDMCLNPIQKTVDETYPEYGKAIMSVVSNNIKKVAFVKKDMVSEAIKALDPVTKSMAKSLLKTEKGLLKKVMAEEFQRAKGKPIDEETAARLDGKVGDQLEKLVDKNMSYVSQTAHDRAEKHLTDLLESNASVDTIQKDISDLFASGDETQARTIARTETLRFTETSRFAALTEMGFNEKEWFHSGHDQPREDHLAADGEVVPMGEKFSTGLQYPGDPEGDAGDVINCGCTFAEHVGAAVEEG